MNPSRLSHRAAVMSALVTGTFVLALTASPAQAIGTPTVGQSCPPLLSAQALAALNLTCVAGTLTALVPGLPTPAATSAAPGTPPATPAPNPLASLAAGLQGAVNGLTSPVTGPAGKAVNGAVNTLLGGSLPATNPTTPGGATLPTTPTTASGTGTGTGATSSTTGSPKTTMTKTTKTRSTKDGSSLLGPAAAFLPGTSLASFADLSSSYGDLLPIADNIPSPLLATPEGKLSAVQAPLIAAGERAASAADSGLFTRFGGKALPGILVVIATAMVAAVGAGNLRAWQAHFGGAKLRAWKRSTK